MGAENELTKIQEAQRQVQAVLDNKELWFELEASALELNDRLDELNDQVRRIEASFRQMRLRPGWVPVGGGGEALVWDGTELLYDTGRLPWSRSSNQVLPLLRSNKERRLRAVPALEDLFAELTRVR